MAADDDLFGVFGSDDEEDNEGVTVSWAGQKLAEEANERMLKSESTAADNITATDTNSQEPLISLEKFELWPNSPPLYLSEHVQLTASLPVGGGRGYVATHSLSPGTLVLVEEPIMAWSEEQLGRALDLISVQQILQHDNAQSTIHDMEDFHPTKAQVDAETDENATQVSDMMQTLRIQYEDDERLEEYEQLANKRNLTCRNGDALTTKDILRLLLALRYNGLTSGVYRHVAMLNHDCHPNCVKFMPTSGYSEVRTTRHVKPGESLTISYLPRIVSHATRRQTLWEQHRFDIGVDLGEWRSMECIGNQLPASSVNNVNESSATYSIESTTSQLEDHCREAEAVVAFDYSSADNPVWNEIKALEVASLELYTESKSRLRNDSHILLIPCLRLHLDTCDLVQRDPNLTRSQRILLLCRLVSSAKTLLELQERLYGTDHFDLARTHLEFAEAMEELLSTAPKQVLQLELPQLTSFEACSAAEHASRKEHERIKASYPHDVDELINVRRNDSSGKECS